MDRVQREKGREGGTAVVAAWGLRGEVALPEWLKRRGIGCRRALVVLVHFQTAARERKRGRGREKEEGERGQGGGEEKEEQGHEAPGVGGGLGFRRVSSEEPAVSRRGVSCPSERNRGGEKIE